MTSYRDDLDMPTFESTHPRIPPSPTHNFQFPNFSTHHNNNEGINHRLFLRFRTLLPKHHRLRRHGHASSSCTLHDCTRGRFRRCHLGIRGVASCLFHFPNGKRLYPSSSVCYDAASSSRISVLGRHLHGT